VVLLDVKLPDADGLDLLPQIKKRWPDTEVIVLTGDGTFEHGRRGHQARRLSFSAKPFETKSCSST
jgi:DNA-binding NtrC family response regulator